MTNRNQTAEILRALAEAEEHAGNGNVSDDITRYADRKAFKLREIADRIESESQDQGM